MINITNSVKRGLLSIHHFQVNLCGISLLLKLSNTQIHIDLSTKACSIIEVIACHNKGAAYISNILY